MLFIPVLAYVSIEMIVKGFGVKWWKKVI
jgi:hypothetical protein